VVRLRPADGSVAAAVEEKMVAGTGEPADDGFADDGVREQWHERAHRCRPFRTRAGGRSTATAPPSPHVCRLRIHRHVRPLRLATRVAMAASHLTNARWIEVIRMPDRAGRRASPWSDDPKEEV
jgi:hypothetical protein